MHIGLISDTHIPDHAPELPAQIKEVFRGVDMILHAGDVYIPSVLDELESIAPILAAEGDDDIGSILKDRRVKKEHLFTVEGLTIWLLHEFEIRSWDGRWDFEVKLWEKPGKHPDIIVYGHTHTAKLKNGVNALQINPGSPTLPGYRTQLGTVALLDIVEGKAEAKIVQLEP